MPKESPICFHAHIFAFFSSKYLNFISIQFPSLNVWVMLSLCFGTLNLNVSSLISKSLRNEAQYWMNVDRNPMIFIRQWTCGPSSLGKFRWRFHDALAIDGEFEFPQTEWRFFPQKCRVYISFNRVRRCKAFVESRFSSRKIFEGRKIFKDFNARIPVGISRLVTPWSFRVVLYRTSTYHTLKISQISPLIELLRNHNLRS